MVIVAMGAACLCAIDNIQVLRQRRQHAARSWPSRLRLGVIDNARVGLRGKSIQLGPAGIDSRGHEGNEEQTETRIRLMFYLHQAITSPSRVA
jgi:hypothetical protein